MSWITSPLAWLKEALVSKYLGILIRQGMSWLGGIIAALGIVDPKVLEAFISSGTQVAIGVAGLLLAMFFSWLQKKA